MADLACLASLALVSLFTRTLNLMSVNRIFFFQMLEMLNKK